MLIVRLGIWINNMKKILGIVVLVLLFCNVANAAITVKIYLDAMSRNNKEITSLIEKNIMGINSGLMYANNELKHSNKERLYCQPSKLKLNAKMLIAFLDTEIDNYIQKGIAVDVVPIGMLLVKSLKKNFPCN